jgi:hypothetical protein
MINRYNNLSLLWGVPGLVLQFGGRLMQRSNTPLSPSATFDVLGPVLILAGTLALLIGFAYYAKAKGRSAWWSLFAFLSILGVLVLVWLKDKTEE